jgi:hypothetical protein
VQVMVMVQGMVRLRVVIRNTIKVKGYGYGYS